MLGYLFIHYDIAEGNKSNHLITASNYDLIKARPIVLRRAQRTPVFKCGRVSFWNQEEPTFEEKDTMYVTSRDDEQGQNIEI